jgi:hypothetical protein
VRLFGPAGGSSSGAGTAEPQGVPQAGAPPTGAGGLPGAGAAAGAAGAGGALPSGGGFFGGAGPGAGGAFGGEGSLTSVLSYISEHGGGTLAVSSQSTAATAIIHGDANVAGIGGFSGRESDPSVSWLAQEVRDGQIRWVLDEQDGGFGGGAPGGGRGETRVGSKPAMAAVAKACAKVTLSTEGSGTSGASAGVAAGGTLYDCQGDAAALASVSTQQSKS